jgi:hypothetical protein
MPIESIKYSIPYLTLVVWFIFLFIVEYKVRQQDSNVERNIQIVRWISLGSILFFFGLRGFVGWDWTSYYPKFSDVPTLFSLNNEAFANSRFEAGFLVFMSLIKTIWNNYQFFVFINTLTDLLILFFVFKQFAKYSFSLSSLVFIAMGGFYLEVDLLRNAKSIMLFILSLKYLRDRNLGMYMALNILGMFFHITALLFVPLYFFLYKPLSRKVLIITFLAGLAVFFFQIEYIRPLLFKIAGFFGEKFELLLDKYLRIELYSTAYGFTIGLLERILTTLLLIKYYNVLLERDRNNVLFINSFIIFLVLYLFFSEINVIPTRVGGLFSFSYWILYPAIYDVIQNKNNKILFLSFVFIYTFIKIAGITDNIFYRYVNVFLISDDYGERLIIFEKLKEYFLN